MRNSRIRLLGLLLALHLPGCETIKSFFPDKQKDYRYSKEIPPLELPPELKSESIKMDDDIHPRTATQSAQPAPETPSKVSSETPAKKPEQAPQNVVGWSDGGNRLQINKPFDKAWFVVSQALTHKAVEITDYDRSQGVFFVQYDAEKYEIQDGSIWDEVAFFFGARDSHELQYRVRVIDNGERTSVVVTDDKDVPVTQEPGISLTKLLFETIKALGEGKQKPEGKAAEKSGEEKDTDTEQKQNTDAETEAGEQSKSGAEDSAPADSEKQ